MPPGPAAGPHWACSGQGRALESEPKGIQLTSRYNADPLSRAGVKYGENVLLCLPRLDELKTKRSRFNLSCSVYDIRRHGFVQKDSTLKGVSFIF